MAYATLILENPNTLRRKEAPIGFSWTVFFFGCFPPLLRSDWKWAIIMFLLAIVTYGFSGLLFSFIYNKLYLGDLIRSGFKAKSIDRGTMEGLSQKLRMNIPVLEAS